MKYKLFSWYTWGFGSWRFEYEANTLAEIRKFIRGRDALTYAITADNKVVDYKVASLRPYMSYPSFPIRYNGEVYNKGA